MNQTLYLTQEEFTLHNVPRLFQNIDLMKLVEEYGTPIKFTYLPQISSNINKAKGWFRKGMEKIGYEGKYYYCYCTKSSHFEFIMNEAFKNNIHIETSSAIDINIVEKLLENGKINKNTYVVCNGFKRDAYVENIARLINNGHNKTIPVIDNYEELDLLQEQIKGKFKIGIRIAAEEEPKFEFYTSRLGIGYKDIVPFYRKQIQENKKVELKMLHFFINTGIRDTAYYWNELLKCMKVYIALKKECPTLDSLNIGGGFPIKNSLAFEYDYQYMV
ncbi:MAG: arginine decarboxylase, partial [Flavobacterium sp.]